MKKVYSFLTKALALSVLLALPLAFYAQDKGADGGKTEKKSTSGFSPYWFIQGEIGANWSHADLSKYGFGPDFNHTNFNGLLGVGYQFSSVFRTYADFQRGFYGGEKEGVTTSSVPNAKYGRDMYFDNDYFGGNLNLGMNVSNLIGGYKDRTVSFGIHAGVGQVQWKSKTYDLNTDQVLATHGYSGNNENHNGGIDNRKVALSVPVGFNVDFNVSDKWDLYGDYSYTWLDTDIADGVNHGAMEVYNDVFSTFNIGARYKFGGNSVKSMGKNFEKVQLTATPDPVEEQGDSVQITVKGTFPPKYFNKKAVMCFQPVIKYEGGEKTFAPMVFKGENVAGDGELVSYKNGGSFTYTAKVPYEEGMEVSEVYVAPVIYTDNGNSYESCKDALNGESKAIVAPERKLADGVVHTSKYLKDSEVFVYAPHGYEKVTVLTKESNLYFQVNLANLNWHLPLNKKEETLNALKGNLDDLQKGYAPKDITINGWASPEGEETFNQGLSQRRAETAEKYMKNKIKRALRKKDNGLAISSVDDINFVLNGNGPDWNGFMKAVENSNIKDKNAILNVVNSADASRKEEEIRNMILIYPEIERDILPPLRRAIIDVNTFEPKRTDEEIAQLSTSADYAQLSVAELLYAATLTDDLNTKKQIYANTMAKEPKCWRAVVNAAAVDLQLGNMDEAKVLLEKAVKMNENSAEVRNQFGIYHALNGDFKKAEHCFMKARELGANEDYNLGIVNIFKGNYAEAVNLLKGTKCDYNLGLAQLLNKDYESAVNTLKCAPEDAQTDYLIAIAYARQDNKADALNYLGKAIKADASYAKTAAMDREFLKFASDASFQALVK